MGPIRAILIREIRQLLGDRKALLLMVALPLVLVAIMGFALSPAYRSGDARIYLPFVDNADNTYSAALAKELEANSVVLQRKYEKDGSSLALTDEVARKLVEDGSKPLAIVIPASFPGALGIEPDALPEMEMHPNDGIAKFDIDKWGTFWMSFGEGKAKIQVYADPGRQVENGIVIGLLYQAVMKTLFENMSSAFASRFNFSKNDDEPDTGVNDKNGFSMTDIIDIDVENVAGVGGKRKFDPFLHGLPGYAIMFLLFAVLEAASGLIQDRKNGLVGRMLAGPVTYGHIFAGKALFTTMLGFMQLAVLFTAGILIFQLAVPASPVALAIVALACAFCAAGLGMFVFSISSTPSQSNATILIIVLSMSALGGSWFPSFLMPEWMQMIGKFTVNFWAMDGFMKVLWFGKGIAAIWSSVAVLVFSGAALFTIAWLRSSRRPAGI